MLAQCAANYCTRRPLGRVASGEPGVVTVTECGPTAESPGAAVSCTVRVVGEITATLAAETPGPQSTRVAPAWKLVLCPMMVAVTDWPGEMVDGDMERRYGVSGGRSWLN